MFRFRDPKQPPRPPQPWHAKARRCAGGAARGALLGAAAAAKASADALKWAAERRPDPPAPPRMRPIPVVVVSPPPPVMAFRPPRPTPRCGKSSSKVLPILAGALVVGFVVALTGVKSGGGREAAAPPAPQNMARLSPAKLTDYAADNGVLGGAKAAMKALEAKAKAELAAVPQPVPPVAPILPIPPLPTKPTPPDRVVMEALHLTPPPAAKPKTAVTLTGVKSREPQTTREAALRSALEDAQGKLAEQFAKLDPPLDTTPGLRQIEEQYLRRDKVAEVPPTAEDREAWGQAGLDPNRFWVTADVEVSEDQVRQLRSDHRLATAGPLFAVPFVLAAALYGFLRFDAWSRGHLTGPLGLFAFVSAAVGVIAVLFAIG